MRFVFKSPLISFKSPFISRHPLATNNIKILNDSLNPPLLQLQLMSQKPQWLGSSEGFLRLVCTEPPDLKDQTGLVGDMLLDKSKF